jgi:hypothetical protein
MVFSSILLGEGDSIGRAMPLGEAFRYLTRRVKLDVPELSEAKLTTACDYL